MKDSNDPIGNRKRNLPVWSAVVKATSITHCECVSAALVIQHAKRMRRIILRSVGCLVLSYFFTLSHKRHDFR
jgi:hypothetical protein